MLITQDTDTTTDVTHGEIAMHTETLVTDITITVTTVIITDTIMVTMMDITMDIMRIIIMEIPTVIQILEQEEHMEEEVVEVQTLVTPQFMETEETLLILVHLQ